MRLQDRYMISPEVLWEPRQSFYVLAGGRKSGLSIANPSLIDLLQQFDGKSSVNEIIHKMSAATRSAVEQLPSSLYQTIQELADREIILPANGKARARQRKSPQKQAEQFSHLYIELTSKCNLRCKHCYMEGGLARPNELRLSQMLTLIEEFAELGGAFFTLSGGEPLLYPNWPALAKHAAKKGLRLALMTNGTYLDQKSLDLIKALGITVGLGLDGIRAETHDANRGKGSFAETMQALQRLADNHYLYNTTICFTPMRFNIYDLPGVVEMMRQRGLPRLYVSLLEARGRAEYFMERLQLTEAQRQWLIGYLYQASLDLLGTMAIEVTHHVEIFQRLIFNYDDGNDDAAKLTIRITSDGEVYLSAYMGAPEHQVGQVGKASLKAMLNSPKAGKILGAIERRVETIPKCRNCVYKGICRGGSAVLAHSKFGTFNEPDEFCESRISLFQNVVAQKASQLRMN